jgi:hypothetical protein
VSANRFEFSCAGRLRCVCHRATTEDDLDSCATYDASHCARSFDSPCECGKAVAELAAWIADLKPSLMTRLVSLARQLAHATCAPPTLAMTMDDLL